MSYASLCYDVVCLCVECFCLMSACVLVVIYCVAWFVFVCVGACVLGVCGVVWLCALCSAI